MAHLAKAVANLAISDKSEAPDIAADPYAGTVRSNHKARGITVDFQRAARGLRAGQVVMNDTFTLFEAVQALEIMDPKMDSGFLEPGESLYQAFDLSKRRSASEILGIMDQMLRYELAWHQGYPLSQTLFTSLHLDCLTAQKRSPGELPVFPAALDDPGREDKMLHLVLRAYCVAAIKCCDISVEMIASQLYFEEEDFCTQTYGRDLFTDVPDDEAIQLLEHAVSWITESHFESGSNGRVFDGLAERLLTRKEFILAFVPAENKPLPNRFFDSCLKRLKIIRESHVLGEQVQDAFSAKMHRRLASTAPPRQPIELNFDETCLYLESMYNDLRRSLDVVGFDANGSSLKSFLWSFSQREPQPCPFARAFLQSLTVGQAAVASPENVGELIWTDLEVCVPPVVGSGIDRDFWSIEHPGDNRFKAARLVDFFIERAAPEYTKLYQGLCQNRCRIRRCLANVLGDLDNLLQDVKASEAQMENDDFAAAKDKLIISTRSGIVLCLELQMRQIMQWIVQLGFEQDLFQVHELGLGQWMVHRFSSEITSPMINLLLVKGRQDRDMLVRRMRIEAKLSVERITTCLSDGLAVIYHVLHRLGCMPADHHLPFSTPRLQYELRVQPFLGLSSYKFPDYEDFCGWRDDTSEPLAALVESAGGEVEEARSLIQEIKRDVDPLLLDKSRCEREWDERLQKTEKVCVRAKLLLHTLRQGLAKHGEIDLRARLKIDVPPSGKRDSGWWVLPDIKIQ